MIVKFILRLIYKIILIRVITLVMRRLGVPSIFHPKSGGMTGRIANYGLDKKAVR